jgi:hypothetical protein
MCAMHEYDANFCNSFTDPGEANVDVSHKSSERWLNLMLLNHGFRIFVQLDVRVLSSNKLEKFFEPCKLRI